MKTTVDIVQRELDKYGNIAGRSSIRLAVGEVVEANIQGENYPVTIMAETSREEYFRRAEEFGVDVNPTRGDFFYLAMAE